MDDQYLELEAERLLKSGVETADSLSIRPALYSIAVSLKRIADKLELSQKQPVTMTAEEYAIYKARYEGKR